MARIFFKLILLNTKFIGARKNKHCFSRNHFILRAILPKYEKSAPLSKEILIAFGQEIRTHQRQGPFNYWAIRAPVKAIYYSWTSISSLVDKVEKPDFKGFYTLLEAHLWTFQVEEE